MSQDRRHAVVIGSGIAGLVAARVLCQHFDRVSVVDRDLFPARPDHRAGVPQSRHVHGLQPRGAEIIYDLFPQVRPELHADGAAVVDDLGRVKIVTPEGLLPLGGQAEGGAMFYSRFLLEWRLREILSHDPHVTFLPGTEVVGLHAESAGAGAAPPGVRGVRVRHRNGSGRTDAADAQVMEADLVVDASGRRSHVPAWLEELGYGSAHEETLNSELSYASRFYTRPEGFPDEFSVVIVNGRPPDTPKAGLVQDIENGQWHVTLGGLNETVPTDEEGFLRWASELADPCVYEAIRVARPLTPIRGWRTPTSRWRHFERMPHWPSGLIVIGDAVCALNPIYGQGMTVAAMEAMVLRDCLRDDAPARRGGFERRFQSRLARTVAAPWLVSSSEDLRWPTVSLHGARAPRGLSIMRRYLDLTLRAAVHDPVLAERYFAVIGMTALPSSLFAPPVLARVARHTLGRMITPRSALPTSGRLALSPQGLAAARAMPTHELTDDHELTADHELPSGHDAPSTASVPSS